MSLSSWGWCSWGAPKHHPYPLALLFQSQLIESHVIHIYISGRTSKNVHNTYFQLHLVPVINSCHMLGEQWNKKQLIPKPQWFQINRSGPIVSVTLRYFQLALDRLLLWLSVAKHSSHLSIFFSLFLNLVPITELKEHHEIIWIHHTSETQLQLWSSSTGIEINEIFKINKLIKFRLISSQLKHEVVLISRSHTFLSN